MKRLATNLIRWLIAALASLLIAVPTAFTAAVLGVGHADKTYYEGRERPPLGEDDLGFGLFAVGAGFGYGGGTFVLIWPIGTWLANRWLRKRAA
jgi:hypothetical protein